MEDQLDLLQLMKDFQAEFAKVIALTESFYARMEVAKQTDAATDRILGQIDTYRREAIKLARQAADDFEDGHYAPPPDPDDD